MDSTDRFFMAIFGLIMIAVMVLCGISGYSTGYQNGQIDAANGRQLWVSVETDDGTRWYRPDKPMRLVERETE